jgi:hypothetical protein
MVYRPVFDVFITKPFTKEVNTFSNLTIFPYTKQNNYVLSVLFLHFLMQLGQFTIPNLLVVSQE